MIKVLYAGSPEASAATLQILLDNQKTYDFEIAGVLSNPATAKGRHSDLIPTAVAQVAISNNIPIFTPEHLDSAARDSIQPLNADLLVSFAYGHIFGPKFLGMFKYGGINLHPSLLPKYRGCTPVPAAILNRDEETAVTIQKLALKMDEGEILAQEIVKLDGTETGESLLNDSAQKGAVLILEVLKQISQEEKMPAGKPQVGEPSYTGIIKKEDGKINWSHSASSIEAKIRAYYPEPGCWTTEPANNNLPLRILSAKLLTENESSEYENEPVGKVLSFVKSNGIYIKTGEGVLCVTQLQRQGKKAMTYKDFMNGARDFIGSILS